MIATALAVPIGIVLGSSDFLGAAFRVPIEFLRPIPSAALVRDAPAIAAEADG